jgi:paraquat-inducible protein A
LGPKERIFPLCLFWGRRDTFSNNLKVKLPVLKNGADGVYEIRRLSMSTDIACHGCDLLVEVKSLADGERAHCPRCGGFLTQYNEDAFSHTIAYSISGLILLILANSYSFLSFSTSGLANEITLGQTPLALWDYGMPGIAVIVGLFIIYIPALVLLMLLGLCIPLDKGRYYSWMGTLAKGIFIFKNWAMVEVFIIGVIVSLVKITALAAVALGISFWAYVGFALAFTFAIASLDRYQCWERLEALEMAEPLGTKPS